MHLERNLNPTLSALYVVSGVVMLAVAVLALLVPPAHLRAAHGTGMIVLVLAVSGVLSILSGALHH